MAADESQFVRTALPLNDSFQTDDSSLALPSEDKLTRPEQQVKHRRSRVDQQVQLTLSRKGRRPPRTDFSSHTWNRFSGTQQKSTLIRTGSMELPKPSLYNAESEPSRPVRRVEISNWQEPPRDNRGYSKSRYGTSGNSLNWRSAAFTLPVRRAASLAEHLHAVVPSQHHAYSETLRNAKTFVSGRSATLQRPVKAYCEDDPLDDVFLPESVYITPSRLQRQKTLERQTWKKSLIRTKEEVMGSQDLSWLVGDERQRQGTVRRQHSQSGVMASMEMNTNRVAGAVEQEVKKAALGHSIKRGKQGEEMTLKKAVNLLTEDNTEMQIKAVNFIQNQCFSNPDAKKKLSQLNGIPKLLELLDSENEELQRGVAGALRNVVYENNENKMEVKDCNGIPVIMRSLKRNRDVETRRQLTGLLWNLSSHDMLKEKLGKDVVEPLTQNVLVPCSGVSEGEDPKLELLADPEVFLNATGCLRNLSSAGPNCRTAIRDCDTLIDSLVYYVRGTIADYKPDDKALENCVCTLHNLTYQFEAELPKTLRPVLKESNQSLPVKTVTPGCFSMPLSNEVTEDQDLKSNCQLLEENGNPHGVEWLWSGITIRMYLSLVAISNRQLTQEASIGAMQNLTAGIGGVSQATANIIVQKEGGLQQIKKILLEGEEGARRASLGLLKNLSRYRELHSEIIKQVLPELAATLPSSDANAEQCAEITAVCQILNNLSQTSQENAYEILTHGVLRKIINISTSGQRDEPTRAGQAASVLLHTLWAYSNLHGTYKKAGYKKTDFINSKTVKAVNSIRD